jgi:hypothetical protein
MYGKALSYFTSKPLKQIIEQQVIIHKYTLHLRSFTRSTKHYVFTPEELDFIINYDIKYRMGLGNLTNEANAE